MKNSTDVELDMLRENGEWLDEIVINEQNKTERVIKPIELNEGDRLFAYADVFPEEGGSLDEVTSDGQWAAIIRELKNGRFGYYLGDLDEVFITLILLIKQTD